MRAFPRPKIVISRCIEFDHCRYDGSMMPSDFIRALKPYVDFSPVCAEMEIGLGVPRSSVRIVAINGRLRLIQPATGLDVTDKMEDFSARFLSSLNKVDGFILKYRSPSCGMKNIRVYSSTEGAGSTSKASGFFGGEIIKFFPDLAIEDEGRLRNINIREHFLTKLYSLAGFREIQDKGKISDLIQFHTSNKLLLMAYSQNEARTLGNIVANHEKRDLPEQYQLYRAHLARALRSPAKYTSKINIIMHSLGYFSEGLSKKEKAHFLESVDRYRNKKVSFSSLLAIIQSWTARFDEEYLRDQTFFEPFPKDLIDLCRDTQCEWIE